MRIYAVVEYMLDEVDPTSRQATCIAHKITRQEAEAERDIYAKPVVKLDESFSYAIVSFPKGSNCPICRRNFGF